MNTRTRCTSRAEFVSCAGWPRWERASPDYGGRNLVGDVLDRREQVGIFVEDDEDDWSHATADPYDPEDDRPRMKPWEWDPTIFCDASTWCDVPDIEDET